MADLYEIGKKYSFDITMTGKHYMLCELSLTLSKEAGGLGVKYLKKIKENIELVLSSKIDVYEFGFDSTIIDFKKEKSIINYNYFRSEIEVDSISLYDVIKDWLKEETLNQ
ncbi:hypothetical protein [Flammeovirga kamogawensis]|uniref:Uncharacterized protein n=1 Tax=Flammeovirga kamogawensis TaxID=373891 RepID=A0ABX8H2C7_9BACT|nr:hypothetical protein [Flammeovirga kamogawensis]MBB6460250.1 hypothetical protein [Flammeovirga kamogawensis]QWG10063.1 hypothetical protein KM029_20485 [Flammeovirga kamogawensis]TRX65570.1 hypothetical protein EO216_23915 [Flammeovirga kamogawensis]